MKHKFIKYLLFFFSIFAILLLAPPKVFGVHSDFDTANLREDRPDLTVVYDRVEVQPAWELVNEAVDEFSEVIFGQLDVGAFDRGDHDEFSGVDTGSTNTDSFDSSEDHGTAVAGIIGANNISDNSSYEFPHMNGIISGIKGIDYVMEYRELESIRIKDFENRLDDLIQENVEIINLSIAVRASSSLSKGQREFGLIDDIATLDDEDFEGLSDFFQRYVDNRTDTLFSISAANESVNSENATPANATSDHSIIVGGTDVENKGQRWIDSTVTFNQEEFVFQGSNFGNGVDLAAPAADVYTPSTSTPPSGLDLGDYRSPSHPQGFFDGTSASAPMVSGVAGMMKSINSDLEPERIV